MTPAADPADVLELRRLTEEYGHAVDVRDGERFARVFTPDGVLGVVEPGETEPAITYEGHAELAAVPELVSTWQSTMHLMANHMVDLDGDRGTGLVYGLSFHFREAGADGRGEDTLMVMHYRDEYLKLDGRWRIRRRDVLRQWTEYHAGERARLADSQARG